MRRRMLVAGGTLVLLIVGGLTAWALTPHYKPLGWYVDPAWAKIGVYSSSGTEKATAGLWIINRTSRAVNVKCAVTFEGTIMYANGHADQDFAKTTSIQTKVPRAYFNADGSLKNGTGWKGVNLAWQVSLKGKAHWAYTDWQSIRFPASCKRT